jgi:hypothetical protein
LRTEKKEITLEPILHPIVSRLVNDYGKELYVKTIWEAIKQSIEGYSDDKNPNEYHTLEYATIYNNSISNILEHTFGGRPKHKEDGNIFIFDTEELSRVGRAYNLITEMQTKIVDETVPEDVIGDNYRKQTEGSEGSEGSTEAPSGSSQNEEAPKQSPSADSVYNLQDNGNKSKDSITNIVNISIQKESQDESKDKEPSLGGSEPSDPSGQVLEDSSIVMDSKQQAILSLEPAQPTQPTQQSGDNNNKPVPENIISKSIYRFRHSDNWGCNKCKSKGDKWFMIKHVCKGASK